MIAPSSTFLRSLDGSGCGPEVEFSWCEDRFTHVVWLVREGERVLIAESVVDSKELGIALAELHPQLEEAPSPTLFLHGAGGGAQWSMSVEAAGEGTLRFDVAARVLRPPVERELVYRLHEPDTWLRLKAGEGIAVVGPTADGRATLRMTGEPPANCPCTLRWQYAFTSSSG